MAFFRDDGVTQKHIYRRKMFIDVTDKSFFRNITVDENPYISSEIGYERL